MRVAALYENEPLVLVSCYSLLFHNLGIISPFGHVYNCLFLPHISDINIKFIFEVVPRRAALWLDMNFVVYVQWQ